MSDEPSASVRCEQCGEEFTRRGLPGHIRAVHDRRLGRAWNHDRRVIQSANQTMKEDDA